MLGLRGATVWLTGLPASGKSTIAEELERALVASGRPAYLLDGENVRHGLSGDLGFSAADRHEHARRVASVARMIADAGLVTVVALVSPAAADRDGARQLHEEAGLDFIEAWVDTPLEVCERRDPHGMYARARAGTLSGFTGSTRRTSRPSGRTCACTAPRSPCPGPSARARGVARALSAPRIVVAMGVAEIAWSESFARRTRSAGAAELNTILAGAPPGVLSLAGGFPNPATFPTEMLDEIVMRLVRDDGGIALQYAACEGVPSFRDYLVDRQEQQQGRRPELPQLMVTSGGMECIALACQSLIDPGDAVAVEAPTYLGALMAFARYEAEVHGIAMDEDGLVVEALEERLAAGLRPKLLYVIPEYQNPTGRTLTLERRHALVELCRRHGVLIFEDVAYREISFDGALASVAVVARTRRRAAGGDVLEAVRARRAARLGGRARRGDHRARRRQADHRPVLGRARPARRRGVRQGRPLRARRAGRLRAVRRPLAGRRAGVRAPHAGRVLVERAHRRLLHVAAAARTASIPSSFVPPRSRRASRTCPARRSIPRTAGPTRSGSRSATSASRSSRPRSSGWPA